MENTENRARGTEESAWEKAKMGLKCCIEGIETCTCPDGCPWENDCWGVDDAPLHVPALREALKAMEAAEAPHPAIRAKWINECIMRGTDCAANAENNPPDCVPARLMSLEDLRTGNGRGLEEVWCMGDQKEGEAEGIWLAECVWINGHIMLGDGCTADAHEAPYVEGYGKKGGCRVWSGLPTDQQRMEAPWGESP